MNDDDTTIHVRDDGVSLAFCDAEGNELARVDATSPGDLDRVRRALQDSIDRETRERAGQGIGAGFHEP